MSLKSSNLLDHDLYSIQHSAENGTGSTAQAGGLLVYYTESSSPPPSKSALSPDNSRDLRAERYMLQAVAREVFVADGNKKKLQYPANRHRTAKCLHVRIAENVGIKRSIEHNKAFYVGLSICGNSWTCPVCAAKVQERRRLEIAQAFAYAYGSDRKMIMVTFTFPHYSFQTLSDLLSRQSEAYKRLRSGKAWEKTKGRIGFGGLIRSLEVTLGDNGWHPHTHEAWLVSKNADVTRLREEVAKRWLNVCKKAGLVPKGKESAFLEHSVKITDNCDTSEYLAKHDSSKHWGADRELAKANSKTSRSIKGFHPFALLADIASEEPARPDAAQRWLEYADAMKGRAQIFWSKGLKDEVGVKEKTDEEIAHEQEDKADSLALLTAHQWRIILRYKARAEILNIAEREGAAGIQRWLADHEESTQGDYSDVAPMSDQRAEFKKAKAIITKRARLKREAEIDQSLNDILDKAKADFALASAFPSYS
ncbi:protein rep [Nitrincola nitratireducens]|uniref:Replication protein n=1 Tax=Nitrincola nitratireducens TaxID=1229521 RepID=W9UYQ4_9GAMM|nr:protein rep [Nitrincola nitratireducens]EXJ09037.1 Replication protein [Nitrincola nitratireducens]